MAKRVIAEVVGPEIKMWFPVANDGEINFEARIKPESIIIPVKVVEGIQKFIRKCLKDISGYSKPELDGIVMGLSGGIDSITVASLCQKALKDTRYFFKGIILGRGPFGKQGEMTASEYEDVTYAVKSAKEMGIEYQYIDISSTVNSLHGIFPNCGKWELSGILPRIRSILLLQMADNFNAVCAGTTNGTEVILGAFTVGGPAGHFSPLADFYKCEVYKIAEMLGVPQCIIDRKPLISELGICDEQLYGASCYIIDPIIRRLGWQKKSPVAVSKELGHNVNWIRRIKKLRFEGEKWRIRRPFLAVCREYKSKIKPMLSWNRDSYFNDIL
jgi:NAD+ synthase